MELAQESKHPRLVVGELTSIKVIINVILDYAVAAPTVPVDRR